MITAATVNGIIDLFVGNKLSESKIFSQKHCGNGRYLIVAASSTMWDVSAFLYAYLYQINI